MKPEQEDTLLLPLGISAPADGPEATENSEQREQREWMKRLVSAIVLFWASEFVSHLYGIENFSVHIDVDIDGQDHWEVLEPSPTAVWVECGFFGAVCVYAGYLVLQSNPRSVLLCETGTSKCFTMVMGLMLIALCAPQLIILLGWMLFGPPRYPEDKLIALDMTNFWKELYEFADIVGTILSFILVPLSYCCN